MSPRRGEPDPASPDGAESPGTGAEPGEATGSPAEADPTSADAAVSQETPPAPRVEPEEMGGEAACQLHRFWDVDD